MKKTYREIFEFINAASGMLNTKEPPKETKLVYALRKVLKKVSRQYDEGFAELMEDKRNELCEGDEKGIILKDERGMLKFNKESVVKLNKFQRDNFEEEVEIEPHLVTIGLEGLTPLQRSAFDGFVIEDKEPVE